MVYFLILNCLFRVIRWRKTMSRFGLLLLVIIFAIALSLSCSGGDKVPVSPELSPDQPKQAQSIPTQLWGLWDVTFDPATGTAEIIASRTAQYTMNMVKFLQPPEVPENQIEIFIHDTTQWQEGYVDVDVTLHHPFPNHDFATGFDVRGVIIGNGSTQSQFNPSVKYVGPNDLIVLNADGYTRWFNPVEFTTYDTLFGFTESHSGTQSVDWTATINGYRFFCDGLDDVSYAAYSFGEPWFDNPRAYFAPSSTLKRNYILQFPMIDGNPSYQFQFACVASWAMPSQNPPAIPDDFPIEANAPEVFAARMQDSSDMYYVNESTYGGDLAIVARVFDHQGSVNPSGVPGQIAAVHVESMDGLIPGGFATYTGAELQNLITAEDAESATYTIQINNATPSATGWFPVLVSFESVSPDNYYSGNPEFAYPESAVLSAYFLAFVHVVDTYTNEPPVADAQTVGYGPWPAGSPIELDATGSFDPDGGVIQSYEWDFNNDGTYGDPFDSGTPALPVIHYDVPGTYTIDLKVTDNEGSSSTLGYPLEVFVGSGVYDPFAVASVVTYPPYNVGNPIEFDALQSVDPDGGNIVAYAWDFDGDGTFGDTYDSGTDVNPVKIFSAASTYSVDIQVTDDEGASDTLDYPISLEVGNESLSPIASAKVGTYPPYFIGIPIELDASLSFDQDGGDLVSYAWDFDNDGLFGDPYDSGTDINPIIHFDSEGTFLIDLKVTDNENDTDTLDSLISIDVTTYVTSGWARNMGGPMWDYAYASAVDQAGNNYVTGIFEETADFDPGPGVAAFTATDLWDMFLVKLDADGNYEWAYTWGSEWGDENGYGVACDGDGNVYMTGTYDDTIDFDPGPGVENHPAYGYPDGFIIKFASDGTYQWTKTWGGDSVTVVGATADPSGNVYVVGNFYGTNDFNPNSGTDPHSSGYWDDAFVMMLHGDGSYGWTATFGGDEVDTANGVAVDGSGNVYATGSFAGIVDFDPGGGIDAHTALGSSDIFLVKYDSAGGFQWARTWGASPNYHNGTDVGVNSSGVVAVTGYFYDTVDFDPGPGVDEQTSINYIDTFVSVYNSSGDYQWTRHWSGNTDYYPESHLFVSDSGAVRVTGQFIGPVDFDPGPAEDIYDGIELDVYLTNYDTSGNYLWTHAFGGDYVDWGESVGEDAFGNIYVGGTFFDLGDFEPGPGSDNHYSNGGCDSYMLKLLSDGSW